MSKDMYIFVCAVELELIMLQIMLAEDIVIWTYKLDYCKASNFSFHSNGEKHVFMLILIKKIALLSLTLTIE